MVQGGYQALKHGHDGMLVMVDHHAVTKVKLAGMYIQPEVLKHSLPVPVVPRLLLTMLSYK